MMPDSLASKGRGQPSHAPLHLYYALCRDVTLVLQPYGAAVWKSSIGDFAVTNHTGRIILQACADGGTLTDILTKMKAQFDEDVDDNTLGTDVQEFLASAELQGHVYRSPQHSPAADSSVVGSTDYLSLVRADISITEKCNLHCDYCYVRAPRRIHELSNEQWQEAFARLRAAGARKFIITGGEPFTRRDMLGLLRTADDLGISITLLTNGTLVDRALATELARLSGLREVKISLDSLTDASRHDRFRGAGSWALAMDGARRLYEQGITLVVNMTVHPSNTDELYSAAEECARRGWLLEASPVVLEGRAQHEHMLRCDGVSRYQQLYRMASDDFPQTLRMEETEITPEWAVSFRCAMLFGTVGVTPDGTFKPCLRSEAFFCSLSPMFAAGESIMAQERVDLRTLVFFAFVKNVRSSFVPQPVECGECEFLHGTCNGCVVAKAFMEKAGSCPRKEVIQNEEAD